MRQRADLSISVTWKGTCAGRHGGFEETLCSSCFYDAPCMNIWLMSNALRGGGGHCIQAAVTAPYQTSSLCYSTAANRGIDSGRCMPSNLFSSGERIPQMKEAEFCERLRSAGNLDWIKFSLFSSLSFWYAFWQDRIWHKVFAAGCKGESAAVHAEWTINNQFSVYSVYSLMSFFSFLRPSFGEAQAKLGHALDYFL